MLRCWTSHATQQHIFEAALQARGILIHFFLERFFGTLEHFHSQYTKGFSISALLIISLEHRKNSYRQRLVFVIQIWVVSVAMLMKKEDFVRFTGDFG